MRSVTTKKTTIVVAAAVVAVVAASSLLVLGTLFWKQQQLTGQLVRESSSSQDARRRLLRALDPKTVVVKDSTKAAPPPTTTMMESARDWCQPPTRPPLEYDKCQDKSIINVIPLYGGLTNSLKMILLGALKSFEENRCFTIDETGNEMLFRQPPQKSLASILQRYLEPIGLLPDHPLVLQARKENRTVVQDWRNVWADKPQYLNRRRQGIQYTIPSLGYNHVDGHALKRDFVRRMFRLLPLVRETTCHTLSSLLEGTLDEEFLVFSIRRGDKRSEKFFFATMDQYIQAAHRVIPTVFGGRVPRVFVATDDCRVLPELKQLRPSWTFVSACVQREERGFSLQQMRHWTLDQTDAHYHKFLVELYAMAIATYFVGVTYTNVSWFALFLRQQPTTTFEILATPGTENREPVEWW